MMPAATEEKQSTGGFKPEASSFNLDVKEYIPAGKMAKTEEQFPDFDKLYDAGGKKKGGKGKKGKKVVQQQASSAPQKDVDDGTPWKGKKSHFFEMQQKEGPSADPQQNPNNFDLNAEQWSFMFQYYPEYCAAPYEMMTWLRGQAQAHERIYDVKPREGGTQTTGYVEPEAADEPGVGVGVGT